MVLRTRFLSVSTHPRIVELTTTHAFHTLFSRDFGEPLGSLYERESRRNLSHWSLAFGTSSYANFHQPSPHPFLNNRQPFTALCRPRSLSHVSHLVTLTIHGMLVILPLPQLTPLISQHGCRNSCSLGFPRLTDPTTSPSPFAIILRPRTLYRCFFLPLHNSLDPACLRWRPGAHHAGVGSASTYPAAQ